MNTIYVQFTDQTNTVICSVFGSPQDPKIWPNLGEVQEDDIRYLRFMFPDSYTKPKVLSEVATLKREEMMLACSESITGSSFQSDALGDVYSYDARLVDQINLKVRYDVATFTDKAEPLWASDGVRYEWKLHTASEIMDVMFDLNEHIKSSQVKLASKLVEIEESTTPEQVIAIEW